MSSSIKAIYQRLLDAGISKGQLEKEIQKKAQEYNGFMSRQGILFLIAKELGIQIQDPEIDPQFYNDAENELSIPIEKVKEGMVNIVLIGKVISSSPPREFSRKDGSLGMVGSFIIKDESGEINIVLWDEKILVLKSNILKNEIVKVIGDYAKTNKDGKIEVHISKKGKLILAPDNINPKINQKLKNLKVTKTYFKQKAFEASLSISELMQRYKFIKKIQGKVHIEDFREITMKNGQKTFLLKLLLSDDSGSVIVKIWGMSAVNILKIIEEGSNVRMRNVTSRLNDYTKGKEIYFTKTSSLEVF